MGENWKSQVVTALEALGHELCRDEDGEVDWFACETDFDGGHNGPVCVRCDESWCVHCLKAPGKLAAVGACSGR